MTLHDGIVCISCELSTQAYSATRLVLAVRQPAEHQERYDWMRCVHNLYHKTLYFTNWSAWFLHCILETPIQKVSGAVSAVSTKGSEAHALCEAPRTDKSFLIEVMDIKQPFVLDYSSHNIGLHITGSSLLLSIPSPYFIFRTNNFVEKDSLYLIVNYLLQTLQQEFKQTSFCKRYNYNLKR